MTRPRLIRLLLLLALPLVLAGAGSPAARGWPALLFVSRTPAGDGRIPGFGPAGRTFAAGGRLLVREADGRLRPFLAPGDDRFFDASDPAVSWDGRQVVFAALTAPGGRWRLWLAEADGRNTRPVTADPAGDFDDLDPAWLPDGRIVFASTRFPLRAEAGGGAVSNLFAVAADGGGLVRITTDRNGAEEPAIDPRSGRIVYARWWFSRYLPAVGGAGGGVTTERERAIPADPVDLWHAISVAPDGEGARLAGGYPRIRSETACYQPALLADGTLVGVRATVGSLQPSPGAVEVVAYPGGFARPERLALDAVGPHALADGRIVVSMRRPGSADFGLYGVRRPGDPPRLLADIPGSDELDPVPLAPRERPPVLVPLLPPPRSAVPATEPAELHDLEWTFRFDCLNVFAGGPVDGPFPPGMRLEPGVRIRFWGALSRPESAGGDTLVLVREAPLTAMGGVHEHDMPADTPLFEQLVDARGEVLTTAHGPAHVPGFNTGRFGTGTKCVGCHAGHSALPTSPNYTRATWINVAGAARITLAGEGGAAPAVRSAGTSALTDLRAKGPIHEVAWVADRPGEARLRLEWPFPVEVQEVILYAPPIDGVMRRGLRLRGTEVTFLYQGGRVGRESTPRDLSPAGTRFTVASLRVDAVEILLNRDSRPMDHPGVAALAEVEVIGRPAEE